MPEFFINGVAVQSEPGQTVLRAALAAGHYIPYFCWHPNLSVDGNCRMCIVEVEDGKGGTWSDIACNMPIDEGMKVLTDSETVRARRKEILQLILLNHPVDCGICDKAGECMLQDQHYEYHGERPVSFDPKVRATKFHPLSSRIVLDNERCILCSRCVRFTEEVSGTYSLGIQHRGDHSLLRASEDGAFDADPYSDNVVDICPVGALLSKQFLYKSRVWYLKATPSICPGCERGCNIDIWHRKPEWKLNALDPAQNACIERVTPRDNPAVNGPWTCNKARELAAIFERPRALAPMLKGQPVELPAALAAARRLIAAAQNPVALVSSWASNEELAAFNDAFGARFTCSVKRDWRPVAGEVIEDTVLIKADKNPNAKAALALFGDAPPAFDETTDLVLVWGEGFNFTQLPRNAKLIFLNSYLQPENGHADVFFPISIQTERGGHYTNFEGVVSEFQPCFAKPAGVVDAEQLLVALAVREEAIA
jgi:NADH-quinone oxidoreductase subunit G